MLHNVEVIVVGGRDRVLEGVGGRVGEVVRVG